MAYSTPRAPQESLTAAYEIAKGLTQGLSESQLLWSPGGDTWSLAQIFDHLNLVGYAMLPLLKAAVTPLQATGKCSNGPFIPSLIERWFIKAVSPGASPKMPVPALYKPSQKPEELINALPRFLELQNALLVCIGNSVGVDLAAAKVTSPANSLLRVRLGAWFLALPAHQQYHLLQAQELRNHPHFPR